VAGPLCAEMVWPGRRNMAMLAANVHGRKARPAKKPINPGVGVNCRMPSTKADQASQRGNARARIPVSPNAKSAREDRRA
jgi:hypothetical protein